MTDTIETSQAVEHPVMPFAGAINQALDIAMESGSTGGFEETFDQLEEFLAG